jgi:hypothetical protein
MVSSGVRGSRSNYLSVTDVKIDKIDILRTTMRHRMARHMTATLPSIAVKKKDAAPSRANALHDFSTGMSTGCSSKLHVNWGKFAKPILRGLRIRRGHP